MCQMVKAITNMMVACPSLTRTMNMTPLQTPSQPRINHSHTKGTPCRCKTPCHNRKPVIKKLKRSRQEIKAELKRILKLSFTLDEWRVHLIQRVQDGYDSIFCAGKGYRKSIRNCCSGGTKKDNRDKPPAERSGQSHEGRRPPIIFKRPPSGHYNP